MIDLVFAGQNVFILYLVLAATFLQPLLPCHTSRFLMESMWARHVFGFLTVMFFVAVSETELDDVMPLGTILATSAAIYFWFLLASKMTANWWMVLAVLLAALYLLELYDVRRPIDVHKNIEFAKKVILGLSMAVTLVGFVIYVGEKKLDYKSGFNYTTLLLGTTKCKGTPNVQPYLDSLKAAFMEMPTRVMTGGAFIDAISTRVEPMAPLN